MPHQNRPVRFYNVHGPLLIVGLVIFLCLLLLKHFSQAMHFRLFVPSSTLLVLPGFQLRVSFLCFFSCYHFLSCCMCHFSFIFKVLFECSSHFPFWWKMEMSWTQWSWNYRQGWWRNIWRSFWGRQSCLQNCSNWWRFTSERRSTKGIYLGPMVWSIHTC